MVRQLVERRFPLDLKPSLAPVLALYRQAKAAHWDPERDLPWDELRPEALPSAEREAGRLVWSHRAWIGYGHLAVSPALLVRFCLEHRREADPKYFLSVRGSEDAWYVDAAGRFAQRLGGLVAEPPDAAYRCLFERGDHVAALDADVPLEAFVAAEVAFRLLVEADQLAAAASGSRQGLARQLLLFLEQAKRRQSEFGWRYLEARAGVIESAVVDAAAARVAARLCIERAGLTVPALDESAGRLADAYETAAQAGLGGLGARASIAEFEASLDRAGRRFAALGWPVLGAR